MSDRNMAAATPYVHSPSGEQKANTTKIRTKKHQAVAGKFASLAMPTMAPSIMGAAPDLAHLFQKQDLSGRLAALDGFSSETLSRIFGNTGKRGLIAGRQAFCRLEERATFEETAARTSRAIRVTFSCALLMAAGRVDFGPVTSSPLGVFYLLALQPDVRAHARAWLSTLKVSELRAALGRWEGIALAAMSSRFEQSFDHADMLPLIAAKLPAQAGRAA